MKLQDLQNVLDGNRRKSNTGSQIGILAIGAAIGAAAGMLLAPHSGRVTRLKLKQQAKKGANKTTDKLGDAKDAIKDKAADKVDTAKEATKNAIDEGKRAAKESSDKQGRS